VQAEALIWTEPQFKDLCHYLERSNDILRVAVLVRAFHPRVLYSTVLIIHPLKQIKCKLLYTASVCRRFYWYLVTALCLLHKMDLLI
jgi:hypothetical protein